MKSQQPRGSGARDVKWQTEAIKLFMMPSSYIGLLLLLISCIIIFMPEMQANAKDFLMVTFACMALLPGI
jgi:hypothetical protein